MKKLVFIGIFVCLFSGLAGAAEKKYLSIGGDPIMKDMCAKKKLKTFSLPEDTFVATTGKSMKVYVGWLREGEEIGWLNKEQTEYVVCRCGNSVKFLQPPQEPQEKKVEPNPEPKIEPEPVAPATPATPAVSAPEPEKKKKIIVIINKTETEPVYVSVPVERLERRTFVDYGWGYSGGYAVGGGVVHYHGHRHDRRDHHRDYSHDYRRDYRRPSEPRQRSEPRPRPPRQPKPPTTPKPVAPHPPVPPIPY